MRIIVAGAAGFIGFHLCRRLLDAGHEVVGIDNLITGSPKNAEDLARIKGFTYIRQDICSPLRMDGPVDRVFNLACPASPVDFHEKAVEIMLACSVGVKNLLDLSLEKHSLFLQASTSECYGDPLEHPQKETYRGNVSSIGPRAPYDEGKRFAEAMTMTYHRLRSVSTRMVRIFNTYGPRMRSNDGRALPNFINQALDGQPLTLHGDGSQTRSFCYVDDLVEAILRTADSDCHEPINIGNDEEITVEQAARAVIEMTGSKSQMIFTQRPVNDPERRRPDLSRARELLGWGPTTPWREGFARTIEYFRSTRG
ncbi:MAG: NAD-dependent dehydratase [Planctomycetes bacterium UTPLA1]|nr:MAG: NAD-dependent dehydratase [Planctomycetes bacterium UTPLA1]